LKVDGADCSSVEDLRKGLKGSDLPGSCVVLTVKKLRSVIFKSPHVTDASQLASPSLQFFATFFYATDTHVSQYDYLQNIFDYLQNILSVYMSFWLQGNIEDVPLVRVASEVIADRRTYARCF
jgi:hypothetical protein